MPAELVNSVKNELWQIILIINNWLNLLWRLVKILQYLLIKRNKMAKLTKKQIEEFKQEEKVSEDSSDYMHLAQKVAEAWLGKRVCKI